MDRAFGRIGFMSTQRREDRSIPATKICRRGPRNRWQRTSCTGRARNQGDSTPGLSARLGSTQASGGTVPPRSSACPPIDKTLSLEIKARLATNSLQSDYRIVKLVQIVRQDFRLGSPPFRVGFGRATGAPATHGSSPPHIPSPCIDARFHPTLPRVPAGRRRWTEGYDGKRDLYFQHAA
jgi:hypothetical protein